MSLKKDFPCRFSPSWLLLCLLPSYLTSSPRCSTRVFFLSLSCCFFFVSFVLLFFFIFTLCLVCCSIKRASNSFTSVCSLLYSVGLITTNYSLLLHKKKQLVVLRHVSKGGGGTLISWSEGTRHLLFQRCPTPFPFFFPSLSLFLDQNWQFFPSRPATHMTAVFKAASLRHARLSECGANRQPRDYMKHFVTFVTSKQWLLDGTFLCFLF